MARKKAKRASKVTKTQTPTVSKPKTSEALAIVCLILNIIILPGLGTLIGGRTKEGIWQLVLFLIAIPLAFIIIGIPILIAVWIWGIVSGVRIVQESHK